MGRAYRTRRIFHKIKSPALWRGHELSGSRDCKFKLRGHQFATEDASNTHEPCSQQAESSWFWYGAERRSAHTDVADTGIQLIVVIGIDGFADGPGDTGSVIESACDVCTQ